MSKRLHGRRTALANTSFNVIGLAVSTLIAFLLTPYLFRQLGSEGFAVWVLCGVVIAASHMLDFGLGRALVRRIARQSTEQRWQTINRTFNSLWWPLLVALLFLTAAGWLLSPMLATGLGITADYLATGTLTLRLLFLGIPAVGLGRLLAATLEGVQRMEYTSGALIVNRSVFAVVAVLALWRGYDVLGVAAAYVLAIWIQLLVLLLAAHRITPELRFHPNQWRGDTLMSNLGFGAAVLATNLIALLFIAGNRIILSHWLGLSEVSYFELASVVALQLFTLAFMASQALYPSLVVAQSQGGLEGVRNLYRRALRVYILVLLPLAGALIALAIPFVSLWLGVDTDQIGRTMRWLVGSWMIAAVATAASMGLLALGRPGWTTVFSGYNVLVALSLGLILAPILGFGGVVAANVLAVSTSALLTLWLFGRFIHLERNTILATLSPGVWLWVVVLVFLLGWVAHQYPEMGLLELVLAGVIFLAVYILGLFGFRLLRSEEIAWVRHMLRLSYTPREPSS
ncbi:MAG: oligosaccharide flippase family protein [Chloroflexi bacterium]|nr:oligosaccharide flippase family protein [Chloroflexota bacterium]